MCVCGGIGGFLDTFDCTVFLAPKNDLKEGKCFLTGGAGRRDTQSTHSSSESGSVVDASQ